MEWLLPLAEDYAQRMSSTGPAYLQTIAAETLAQHPKSHMLCGPLVGRLLSMISRLKQPRCILEVGSFTGYSGLCLAEGLAPGGVLHTIENRAEEAALARQNFSRYLPHAAVHLHEGDAHQVLTTLHCPWDLVFLDADKTGYLDYVDLITPHLSPGALLLADNTLFHGEVLEDPLKGKNAKAVEAFNQKMQSDPRWETLLLTVRDGISLMLYKP